MTTACRIERLEVADLKAHLDEFQQLLAACVLEGRASASSCRSPTP